MLTSPRTDLAGALRHMVLRREVTELSDSDLLGRFLAHRDEAAFEALVLRHGAMVLGVCRRVVGHAQDAEDAFQATFLVLARKAASVQPREALSRWLYGVAYHTALKARAAAAKRRAKERQALPPSVPHAPDRRSEIRAILDQELSRLSDDYRAAVVLCDLEGLTRRQAALQLGWPEGTVAGRLARARSLLAGRLSRRGLALPGTGLACALAQEAAAAVPSACLVTAALRGALTAQAAPAVAALAASALRSTPLGRLKIAVLMAGILCLAGVGWCSYGPPVSGSLEANEPPVSSPARTPTDLAQPKERADDWVPLFNGKDLKGWFVEGGDPGTWKVEHGELVVDSGFHPAKEQGIHAATARPRYNWLLTEKTYSEFLLRFEFQLSRGANSGVALWAKPDEKVYREGPIHLEVKLLDDPSYPRIGWPTGTLFWNLDGGSHLLPPDKPAKLEPAGSWNAVEIEARAGSLRVSVNGLEVLSARPDKLAEEPGAFPGLKRTSGHLGFEKNAGAVRFRKIEVKEIAAAGSKEKLPRTALDSNVVKPASDAAAWVAPPAQAKKEGVIFRAPDSFTLDVALTADGKTLARAGADKTIDLWDVASGKKLHTLKGHTAPLLRVAFSPDGKSLASITGTWLPDDVSGEVKLWDVATGKEQVSLKGHPNRMLALAFSPDSRTLATSSGTVKLWDVKTGNQTLELNLGGRGMPWSLAFSPDGQTLAMGSGGGVMDFTPSSVILWDIATGKEKSILPGHANSITWVGFAPDGKTLASASCGIRDNEVKSQAGEIKLWDVATAKERATLPIRTITPLQFFSLAFTADGKTLVSATASFAETENELGLAVQHWDLATGKARATFWAPIDFSGPPGAGSNAGVYFTALSADGKTVAWGGAELKDTKITGTAHVWDVQSLATSPPKLRK